jgi:hypothetical protein
LNTFVNQNYDPQSDYGGQFSYPKINQYGSFDNYVNNKYPELLQLKNKMLSINSIPTDLKMHTKTTKISNKVFPNDVKNLIRDTLNFVQNNTEYWVSSNNGSYSKNTIPFNSMVVDYLFQDIPAEYQKLKDYIITFVKELGMTIYKIYYFAY